MLDNTAKQLSDQLTAVSPSTSHLLTSDVHQIDNRHLTFAKYLPITTFKSAATLKSALDNIHCEINMQRRMGSAPHLRKTSINSMLVNLAKNISITTTDLNTDYGSKLALIDTAFNHRMFSSSIFKRSIRALIKLTAFISRSPTLDVTKYLSDSQQILADAKSEIQKSRDKIILC